MARKPRIHFPGACYHVILRGNAGGDIFFNDRDRTRFFLLLQEGIERYCHRIHAYCLMTNHLHLVVRVAQIPLSTIMQNVSFRYTRFINHRKKRTGHLFQGRYKAVLIDTESYLLELVRYIHNNPVRAGLSKTAGDYPWSSHRAYMGKDHVPWLNTHWLLCQFSEQQEVAMGCYRDFMAEKETDTQQHDFSQGNSRKQILGNDDFAEKVVALASENPDKGADLQHILRSVCSHYRIEIKDLSGRNRQKLISEARAVAAFLVRQDAQLRLIDLSKTLGRDLSTLSQAAGRLEKKMRMDSSLSARIKAIEKQCYGQSPFVKPDPI